MKKDFSVFINRRKELISNINQKYANQKGVLIFFGAFEHEKYKFRQESSMYYYSGLEEPGIVLLVDFDGPTMIYLPNYAESRNKWASSILYGADKKSLESWGVTDIQYLGGICKSYSMTSACTPSEYEYFTKVLQDKIEEGYSIYTTYSKGYLEQSLFIDRLINIIPQLREKIVDVSGIIASMRQTKSKSEIENIYKAIDVTMQAHEAAASVINEEMKESDVEAIINFIYTQSVARVAFPSIVASGYNATILHYNANNGPLNKNDLVVVDIGAEVDYYCADLTRTYPVSGVFTKRQKELYKIVLDAQKYIENLAKPGIWLNNKDKPSQSLHHLAYDFIQKRGYGKYFTHGIGHYLGLDVHDVGDYSKPLKEGDVITIEPGIYIPEEKIGVRIEDNYWITKDSVICLSEDLPKDINLIEDFMALDGEDEQN